MATHPSSRSNGSYGEARPFIFYRAEPKLTSSSFADLCLRNWSVMAGLGELSAELA